MYFMANMCTGNVHMQTANDITIFLSNRMDEFATVFPLSIEMQWVLQYNAKYT